MRVTIRLSKLLSLGASEDHSRECSMAAWRIFGYSSENSALQFNQMVKLPKLQKPNDVLIKIQAASVNPLDLRMKEGYGRTVIDVMRRFDQRTVAGIKDPVPLILGRDCSGVIVDKGRNVTSFNLGDEVWCSVGAERPGCFAQYTVASSDLISKKPKNLKFEEAASIPYVACTVWSALCTTARLHSQSYGRKLSVLIHAGSGGIGTFAIQVLSDTSFILSYDSKVTTTCSSDAFGLVKELGADNAIDYSHPDAFQQLANFGPYDIILKSVDTDLSRKSIQLLGLWRGSMNVDICNPLLRNADDFGLSNGLLQSALQFVPQFISHSLDGRLSVWAWVKPDGNILNKIKSLVESGKIKPVIHKVFDCMELPKAFEIMEKGRIRGKIVIKF